MLKRARSSWVVPLGEKSATKSPTALMSGRRRGLVGPVWGPVGAPAAPRVVSEGAATAPPSSFMSAMESRTALAMESWRALLRATVSCCAPAASGGAKSRSTVTPSMSFRMDDEVQDEHMYASDRPVGGTQRVGAEPAEHRVAWRMCRAGPRARTRSGAGWGGSRLPDVGQIARRVMRDGRRGDGTNLLRDGRQLRALARRGGAG